MMKQKQDDGEYSQDLDLPVGGSPRPARNSSNTRKSASHSSSKRKRSRTAKRKGSATGGMHQRGDKRVVR